MTYREEGELYARQVQDDAEPIALGVFPFAGSGGSISPDGRWLAYTGRPSATEAATDVYVVPFPNTSDATTRISADGGFSPVWAHSGRELLYKTVNRELVAVDVQGGERFSIGDRDVLFAVDETWPWETVTSYDVSLDGDRFLMVAGRTSEFESELIVVENLFEELNRLVPTN